MMHSWLYIKIQWGFFCLLDNVLFLFLLDEYFFLHVSEDYWLIIEMSRQMKHVKCEAAMAHTNIKPFYIPPAFFFFHYFYFIIHLQTTTNLIFAYFDWNIDCDDLQVGLYKAFCLRYSWLLNSVVMKESVGFVQAVCKCTRKIVDSVSFPGRQIPKFWVVKVSIAQQNNEKIRKYRQGAGCLQTQTPPHTSSGS